MSGRRNIGMLRTALASALAVVLSASGAFAFACIEASSGGPCIHWAQHAATLDSFLSGSWDQYAVSAAGDWNAVGADFQFATSVGGQFFEPCGAAAPPAHVCTNTGPINNNPVSFRGTFCGQGFGDIIELTNDCWIPNTGEILNAPVFVNSTLQLSAYDGPIQFAANGQVIYDIRRVLLHEFGHVLGLDHPDEHGQNVVAIMNSHVSDIDRLQADDINGICSIYGGCSPSSVSSPPPSGSSPPPTSGCQLDGQPTVATGWMVVMPLCLVALMLRRRVLSRASAPKR